MYTVTNDFKTFITLHSFEAAKIEASYIKGSVYTFPNGEPLCLFSHTDKPKVTKSINKIGNIENCFLEECFRQMENEQDFF